MERHLRLVDVMIEVTGRHTPAEALKICVRSGLHAYLELNIAKKVSQNNLIFEKVLILVLRQETHFVPFLPHSSKKSVTPMK